MVISLIALVIGFILDLVLGDPYWLPHPVKFMGLLIKIIEKILLKFLSKGPKLEKLAGLILVLIVIAICVFIPVVVLILAAKISVYLRLVVESIMCYQILATKSLKLESMKVHKELKKGCIYSSRVALSMIVGRDTNNLKEEGIIKATIETISENLSDGIIAPMIFIAIGGPCFGFFYKAVNTMDSMVGYKNDKYINFGMCAARLDDILNFIPARVSAYLMILSSFFIRLDYKNAYKIYIRDRYNHSSPNSAHTEAVCAGALNIQLAGDAYYFGRLYKKKTIGDNNRNTCINDILTANKLMYTSAILGFFILVFIKLLFILF